MSKLSFEQGPLVVGVLSALDGTERTIPLPCDVVEVRLDKTARPADWLERCRAIEGRGRPVLLTIRLRGEGGDWVEDGAARLDLYKSALEAVSAVDVELSSVICRAVTEEAQRLNKTCLVSHHDFAKTPPLHELESIIRGARHNGAVPKVATMIRSPADVEILEALLARDAQEPLCVIGMGDDWKETRLSLAQHGSCLAYGYLDRPTAPGQWSAVELTRRLRETRPR